MGKEIKRTFEYLRKEKTFNYYNIKQIVDDELKKQKKGIIREIRNRKFPRGEREWCIECANRIIKTIKRI